MDRVFFCPVCGYVTTEEIADLVNPKNKEICSHCQGKMQATQKDYYEYCDRADDIEEKTGEIIKVQELVRKDFFYGNPLFDKEKYESREQDDQERIARNKAGINPYGNVPKCPTCGSTNLSRLSGTGTFSFFGRFGVTNGNAGKTFKCNNCGYRW